MALSRIQSVLVAAPIVAAVVVPREAAACYFDPCVDQGGTWWTIGPDLFGPIPTDGALLFTGQPIFDGAGAPEVTLTVTLDGMPVAGAFEFSPFDDILAWRPDAPLEPGATYHATGSATLYESGFDTCNAFEEPLDFDFQTDAGPMVPLVIPDVTATPEVVIEEDDGLASLVCCDGADPYYEPFECDVGGAVMWSMGYCTHTQGTGRLKVTLALAPAYPLPTELMVYYSLVVDGKTVDIRRSTDLHYTSEAPFCAHVVAHSFGDMPPVETPEQCYGDPATLGAQPINPTQKLAENCVGPAQVCELDALGQWDPSQCTPWPGGPTTDGGSVTDGGAGTDGGTGTGTGSDPGTGGSSGPASGGLDDLVDHGCGCASHRDERLAWWLALTLGLSRRRRPARPDADQPAHRPVGPATQPARPRPQTRGSTPHLGASPV